MKKKSKSKESNPFYKAIGGPLQEAVYPMRLNKFVAKSGICSRRKAGDLVKEGLIKLNGKVTKEPYILVYEKDLVEYDGTSLRPETKQIYYLLNKPKDVITTTSDEHDRKTVLDLIREPGRERLFPVGRLDRNTTGLLLITNDGNLAKKLSHPSHQVRKEYLVTLDREVDQRDFDQISDGLTLDDGFAPIKELRYVNAEDHKQVLITLNIGRNRIVRRIFEHCGYQVQKLDRVYFAGLTKKNLPRGRYRPLTPREVVMLKHFT